MAQYRTKVRYLLSSLYKRVVAAGTDCPSCGASESELVRRKYLVTELRRCGRCRLLFRTPVTSAAEFERFYQREYQQGVTTTLPDAEELRALIAKGFAGSAKDFTRYVTVLRALGLPAGARVFDYGCSWGYGAWQLGAAGFDVTGYELSQPRRDYARSQLGVEISTDPDQLGRRFDAFFSAHVLEHVPSPRAIVELASRLLVPGGLFIAFTPNGSSQHRARRPHDWDRAWGFVHPNFLDDVFYSRCFETGSLLLVSDPYPVAELQSWAQRSDRTTLNLAGAELLCVRRMEHG